MKIFLKSNRKYFILEKNNFFQYFYQSKKGSINSFSDEKNFSNNRQFLLGNRCKYKKILNSISSKIVFSFSDILSSAIWEQLSGRTIRTFLCYHSQPLKLFFSFDYTLIVILTKKNVLIYNIFDGNLLYNIPLEQSILSTHQLVKGFPLVIISQKYGNFFVLNYQKGYFIKKFVSLGTEFSPDGTVNCCLNYCLKTSRSLRLNSFSDKNFLNFHLLEKHSFNKKKNENENLLVNINFKYLKFQNLIFFLGTKFYMWDFFSRLVIFN
jgi:hypothetical protein